MTAIATKLTPLTGHTTTETAYVVDDYPYGFRLRCKIRYWLEYRAGYGFRLMSQTKNPKRTSEFWNAPKGSTYAALAVMGLDDKGHVDWERVSAYDIDRLAEFIDKYADSLDEPQRFVASNLLAQRR